MRNFLQANLSRTLNSRHSGRKSSSGALPLAAGEGHVTSHRLIGRRNRATWSQQGKLRNRPTRGFCFCCDFLPILRRTVVSKPVHKLSDPYRLWLDVELDKKRVFSALPTARYDFNRGFPCSHSFSFMIFASFFVGFSRECVYLSEWLRKREIIASGGSLKGKILTNFITRKCMNEIRIFAVCLYSSIILNLQICQKSKRCCCWKLPLNNAAIFEDW
jgi:hypothetical protein